MNKFPSLLSMMQQLIACPSISCFDPSLDMSNRPVIELLANWLDQAGFSIQLIENHDNPEKLNLIAHSPASVSRSNPAAGPGLILSGHTDTVPFDEYLWNSDPFSLTNRNNRFYGLGSADMKLFFALALDALRTLDYSRFQRPLTIVATADEETGMGGAKTIALQKHFDGARVIIGEPTAMTPVYSHKGMMTEAIIIKGRSGHSSEPGLGSNALEAGTIMLKALLDWRNHWQQQHQNLSFKVSHPTLNFGCIHGGDNPNRICGQCEFQYDLRLLPGMNYEEVTQIIHNLVIASLSGLDVEIEFKSLFEGVAAYALNSESRFLKQVESVTAKVPETVAFGTEAPYWQALNCEAIILGPGNINQAHQPDEYLDQSFIEPTIRQLQQLIKLNCELPLT